MSLGAFAGVPPAARRRPGLAPRGRRGDGRAIGRAGRLALCLLLGLGCDGGGDADAGLDGSVPAADGGRDDAGGRDAARPQDARATDATLGDAGALPDPLDGAGAVALVRDGFTFLEGPHWRAADGVLLFTDIPESTIHRLAPPDAIDVFRMPSGEANGLATLPDGRLLAAEHANRRVSVTAADGTVSGLATTFEGGRLNSPNDLAVRSDGTVYFTDPPYGLGGTPPDLDFHGVFRVDPAGALHDEWRGSSAQRPNGIGLSPDERVLYVADTADGLVRAFDVAADGSTSGERPFATGTPNADGMAVDRDGNLFVTTADGVAVLAPDGSRWGTITVPEVPANCAFGDADRRTLYVTARTGLYAVRLPIPGR
ncbi:MAG TPA: SMP-30/gluconolactonase/LRE family protein [Sandaracinaceae bacterium LLY-WYZ-13_1]|nr:SMP-30/gluconolactonase/LRE family protein [Sandaracinaceae bacterium LLY-WYZ-13_1]